MSTMSYLIIGLIIGLAIVALATLFLCVFVLPARLIRRGASGTALPALSDDEHEHLKAENDVRTSLLQAFTGLVLVIGVAVTFWQINTTQKATQSQLGLTQQGQTSERFTTAISQLGDAEKADVRLGGIYGLERIAHDSADYRTSVASVLAAYVRGHAPLVQRNEVGEVVGLEELTARTPALEERLPDVQAALTALGTEELSTAAPPRLQNIDLRGASLDKADLSDANLSDANLLRATLSGANLSGANLSNATLSDATLSGANLSDATLSDANLLVANLSGANLLVANLSGANLLGAFLSGANLSDATLSDANLLGANLSDANLSDAFLTGANLSDAFLSGANLTGAYLSGANLTGANLSGANLTSARGLSQGQLDAANGNGKTRLPAGLQRPEHWLNEETSRPE